MTAVDFKLGDYPGVAAFARGHFQVDVRPRGNNLCA